MRYSTFLLPLIGSAAAADQFTFKSLYDKLSSYIPAGVSHPIDTASSRTASKHVTPLTLDNWKTVFAPHPSPKTTGPDEWWLFFTGGNKTCYGLCDRAEKAFNETASLLQASSHRPHFAILNCEVQSVLCASFIATVPSVWQVLVPSAPDSPTPIRIKSVNATTVSASELMSMHTTKSWKTIKPWEGVMHPFDGIFAKLGLNVPIGYVLWVFSVVPNWVFMVSLSFLSRTFLGRRAARPPPRTGPAPPAAAGKTS